LISVADSISDRQGLTEEEEEYLLRDIEENYFGLPNVGNGEYPTLKTILDSDASYPAIGSKGNCWRERSTGVIVAVNQSTNEI